MNYRLNPELEAVVSLLPPMQFEDPAAQRKTTAAVLAGMPRPIQDPRVLLEDHLVSGELGRQTRVRSYRPACDPASSILLWFHGGGYCVGTAERDDWLCSELSAALGTLVLSVEYRLAPEFPFPSALDDCGDALDWVAGGAVEDLVPAGVKIGVAGMSAGAGLAAALTIRSRTTGIELAAQCLLCPFLDDRLSTHSALSMSAVPVFNANDAAAAWRHYLGSDVEDVSPLAAPARNSDFRELPLTFILAAGVDILRDEGIAYSQSLLQRDVEVELHVVPQVPHGFVTLAPTAGASQQAVGQLKDFLRVHLKQAEGPGLQTQTTSA